MENKLINELENYLLLIEEVKELVEREIKKNKTMMYSDKRNNKFIKMIKENSINCKNFKKEWGNELHYL